jgi:hypothetical protein
VAVIGWAIAWRELPSLAPSTANPLRTPVLTMEQYRRVISEHPRPYVYRLRCGNGEALIFGAEHTRDPSDPQLDRMSREWIAIRPTVTLVESRLGFLPPLVAHPVRHFGEVGHAVRLARNDEIPAYTWEPPLQTEIAAYLKVHEKQRVALFCILRPYFSQRRHGRPNDPEAVVEEYRKKRSGWPGIENAFATVDDIDQSWRRDFPTLDWRDESDHDGLPGYLAEIADQGSITRTEHLARCLLDLTSNGHRVFAVMGSSHAVRIEPTLRAASSE